MRDLVCLAADKSIQADAIVIDPELEAWVWSDSPHVAKSLGWRRGTPDLKRWLTDAGLWRQGEAKPADPKEALERALRSVGNPPSAALFEQLAKAVSVERCVDPAFGRFKDLLRRWFPA